MAFLLPTNVSKLPKLYLLKIVNAQQTGQMYHSPSRNIE